MSGYVDNFFSNLLTYINLCMQIDIIKYLLSFYIVFLVLGLLRSLLHVND